MPNDSIETLVGKLPNILAANVNAWQVNGDSIVHSSDKTPLIRDHAAHPQTLALIADALNFTVRRLALQELAKELKMLPAWLDKVKAFIKQMPHQSCLHTGFPHTQCGCGRKHELDNVCWRCALTALLESPLEEK
jgi:hypothetical protein